MIMLGWLIAIFKGLSAAGLLLKVLVVGGGLLVGTNALNYLITGWIAYNKGHAGAVAEMNAAAERSRQKHREFLNRVKDIAGALSDDDAKAETTNDEIERKILDQVGKLSDGAQCLPPTFLRHLDGVR